MLDLGFVNVWVRVGQGWACVWFSAWLRLGLGFAHGVVAGEV